jgi:FkbM family methyltransferase
MSRIKKITASFLHRAGYKVSRINSLHPFDSRIVTALKHFGVTKVLDIGANEGQYAQGLFKYGYQNSIISFEPITEIYDRLKIIADKNKNWQTEKIALSDYSGDGEINISHNFVSSSLENILPAHTAAAPESAYYKKEKIKVEKLDAIIGKYLLVGDKLFIKIDAQGTEDKILAGAEKALKSAIGVQLEVSFVPLYAGQKLFSETIKALEEKGFKIWAIEPGFSNETSGQMLQADIIFIKKDLSS